MSIENFDPMKPNFDPWNGQDGAGIAKVGGEVKVTTGEMGTLTINITNATAGDLTVELFNFLNSITRNLKASVLSVPPFTFADIAKADTTNRVYFNSTGNLIIESAAGTKVTVSCKEFPYVGLFNSSGLTPFFVDKIRLNVTNDLQLNNDIVHVGRTFLGKVFENSKAVRTYFNPNQNQGNIVDVPMSVEISAEKGLQYTVNAGETVNMTFYISAWKKFELGN